MRLIASISAQAIVVNDQASSSFAQDAKTDGLFDAALKALHARNVQAIEAIQGRGGPSDEEGQGVGFNGLQR
jgi:hypothetical protein